MNSHDIDLTLRKLRLSGMAETLQTRVMQAQAAQVPFPETLTALLQDALDRPRSRLFDLRFKLEFVRKSYSLREAAARLALCPEPT